jgi:hypothetical protein
MVMYIQAYVVVFCDNLNLILDHNSKAIIIKPVTNTFRREMVYATA